MRTMNTIALAAGTALSYSGRFAYLYWGADNTIFEAKMTEN